MWISSISLTNVKSFEQTNELQFSKGINVLVGPNNSGKTTIVKSLLQLQYPDQNFINSIQRIGADKYEIIIRVEEPDNKILSPAQLKLYQSAFYFDGTHKNMIFLKEKTGINTVKINHFTSEEPNNFIYPHIGYKKPNEYQKEIKKSFAQIVEVNLKNIYPKVDRITTRGYSKYDEYAQACKEIIGVDISTFATGRGKEAGLIIDIDNYIPMELMGDGTPSLLGFILDLCMAENKLFLIEEPENNIHPKALKSLIDFMIKKSDRNQFIVTTHSNIVTRYLGGIEGSKINNLNLKYKSRIPTTTIEPATTVEERIKLLEQLGYDIMDYELWKGFLILEESSAERIIRDFLIPNFCGNLKTTLRTIAASGVDDVEPRLTNFIRTLVFIHLTPIYKNRTWVVVDGDVKGKKLINKLKDNFSDWERDRFKYFKNKNFENYYPERFKKEVDTVLKLRGNEKHERKKELTKKVLQWINDNNSTAKREFSTSAKEVIDFLKEIEKTLN